MQGTLKITADIPEDKFMEGVLNMYFSGGDVMLFLYFYALANHWDINKLVYYTRMMK